MQEILDLIKKGATAKKRKIVLPETSDLRTLQAAEIVLTSGIVDLILIGNKEEILKNGAAQGLKNLDKAEIIDPLNYAGIDKLAEHYYERRKHKGATLEKSLRIMQEEILYTGAALVGVGLADGMVAGAINATGKVIKAAIYCVGTQPDCPLVSSFFMMVVNNKAMGERGVIFFADSAVNPSPSFEQLANIAKSTADSFSQIMKKEPRVAMLSFSTKGSAEHPDVDKVTSAVTMAKLKYPDLKVDGELQVDAALIPEIGSRKAPESEIAGRANILIFPDLNSGNIGYKLVERLGNAMAFGPILQGLNKPVNDLSRGCSVDDIVRVIEITALLVKE